MEASEGKGSMRMSRRRLFLFLNGTMMCIGSCGGPLLVRLYFIRGGDRIWFSTWISTAGWPITFIPLAAAYYTRRRTTTTKTNFFTITRNITLAGAALGVLLGIINYLYTYGISKLPVSTSSLIVASQLAFTAGAAFVLVKQRFTAFTVNGLLCGVDGDDEWFRPLSVDGGSRALLVLASSAMGKSGGSVDRRREKPSVSCCFTP